jgi:hypothetical protein
LKKSILFFVIIVLLYSNLYSQNSVVQFQLEKGNCDFSTKKNTIYLLRDKQIIDSISVRDCKVFFRVPKKVGIYQIQTLIDDFKNEYIDFHVSQSSKDSIDLGNIVLTRKERVKNLKEITITGVSRNYITEDPEKTTIQIAENPLFSTENLYSAISKLPNIFITQDGQILAGSVALAVQFDGMPCMLSGRDLVSFLKSMPAKIANRIEIVSSPGASYDANLTGGVLNIVTHSKSFKWFSGSANIDYGRSSYDKITPSLILNGRKSKLSWQLQSGLSEIAHSEKLIQNREFISFTPFKSNTYTSFNLTHSNTFFLRPSISLKFKKSMFSFNYSLNNTTTNSSINTINQIDILANYTNSSSFKSSLLNQDVSALYKLNIDSLGKLLEIQFQNTKSFSEMKLRNTQNENSLTTYSISDNLRDADFKSIKYDLFLPSRDKRYSLKLGSKCVQSFVNSNGKYNINNASPSIFESYVYTFDLPFDYKENTFANYLDFKYKIKRFTIQTGLRYEVYKQNRSISNINYSSINQYNVLYPNLKLQFKPIGIINMVGSYRRAISVPVFSNINPNNLEHFDKYTSNVGNPNLTPTINDILEFKASAFEYLSFKTVINHSNEMNLPVFNSNDSSLITYQSFQKYNNVNTINYNFTIPVPFGMFKEGFGYFLKDVNPNDISYLYISTSFVKTMIDNYPGTLKPLWKSSFFTQIILPKKTKLSINYFITGKGNQMIYQINKLVHYSEIILNKSFMNESLNISFTINDLFNTNQNNFLAQSQRLNYTAIAKQDTRSFFISISYSFGMLSKFLKERTEHELEKNNLESDKQIIEKPKGLK